jgi:tripartite-type tricarboxylate transporter receptor subunit TctC
MGGCWKLVLALLLAALPAAAEDAPFYKGKIIRIVISTGVAGGYAEYARLLADHMGDHIAGKPSFIVQSMPGAGGLQAMNFLYTQAPQDGTVMGMVHSSVPLAPLWGTKGARFDALKVNWVGSLDQVAGMCIAWHTATTKSWDDLLTKGLIVGSSGAGSQMDTYPAILNKLFGTKIKVVQGYKDGTDVYLAMERGEVEGRCGGQLAVLKSSRPDWLTQHKINVPIIISAARSAEFPGTPAVMEFVKDENTRQQLQLLLVSQKSDRPVLLPPGVPAERVSELRAAFDATTADPAFRADIDKRNLHIDPVRGEELAAALASAYGAPPEVIAAARETMGTQ